MISENFRQKQQKVQNKMNSESLENRNSSQKFEISNKNIILYACLHNN